MEAKLKKLSQKLSKLEKLAGAGEEESLEAQEEGDERAKLSSEVNMDRAYADLVKASEEMKAKIREIADMNTMGNVQLGLGEAWYQGQGKDNDDSCLDCPHCGGKIDIQKIKKKMYKRKVRRNKAKGKAEPVAPKFMRKGKALKKKPGPKKGGAKSAKQSDWIKFCKAVGKTPDMKGEPWNKVMKKASELRKRGVDIADVKKLH